MKFTSSWICLAASSLLLGAVWAPAAPAQQPPTPKTKITKRDELPRFTYPVPSRSALKLLQSDSDWSSFAARVRVDLKTLLRDYDIEDRTTLRQIHYALRALDQLEGRDDEARRESTVIRALEEKPANKLFYGLWNEALLDARQDTKGDPRALRASFSRHYSESLQKLPWDVVRDVTKEMKGYLEMLTESVVLGRVQAAFEEPVQKTGSMSGDIALMLINSRSTLRLLLPVRDPMIEALRTYIAAHQVVKPEIWTARSATLTAKQKLTPVVIGIWDSGVDTNLFPGQWAKTEGKPGIAFDLEGRPLPDLMYPVPPERLQEYPEAQKLMKGFTDLQAGIDSPEAGALRQRVTTLKPEQVNAFFEKLGLFSAYMHGTHVAGIAVAGNPAARLLVGVITFPYKTIPELLTMEQIRRRAESYQQTAAFFRTQHVRVVNMSWFGSPKDFEQMLESNSVGKDAAERQRTARELFEIEKQGLLAALKNSPDILFVCAAGNANNNTAFDEFVPSSFQLPNLLTVGAVDQAGEETSFTSYGPSVTVHANGFEVESFLPGGEKMALSGTSMASPNVTNLAAKLLALDPALTPAQVIALIKAGSTRSEDGRRNLIDPKRSVELLRQRQSSGRQN